MMPLVELSRSYLINVVREWWKCPWVRMRSSRENMPKMNAAGRKE